MSLLRTVHILQGMRFHRPAGKHTECGCKPESVQRMRDLCFILPLRRCISEAGRRLTALGRDTYRCKACGMCVSACPAEARELVGSDMKNI